MPNDAWAQIWFQILAVVLPVGGGLWKMIQDRYTEQKERADGLTTKNELLEEKNDSLEKELDSEREERLKDQEQLKDLKRDLTGLKEDFERSEFGKAETQKRFDKLFDESLKAKKTILEQNETIAHQNTRIAKLTTDLTKQTKLNSELQRKHETLRDEKEARIRELTQDNQTKADKVKRMTQELNDKDAEIMVLQQEKIRLEAQLGHMREQMERNHSTTQERMDEMQTTIDKLTTTLADVTEKLERLLHPESDDSGEA